MNKQGKVWGNTELLLSTGNCEIHRLEMVKGGYCSMHLHKGKSNYFYVEDGKVQIEQVTQTGKHDKTTLNSHEECNIPANVKHKFIALENSIVYEIYTAQVESNDIERDDEGGIL